MEYKLSFHLGKYLGVGLLGCTVNFTGNFQYIVQCEGTFRIPTSNR